MTHRAKTNLFIDIIIFVTFLIVYNEKGTGATIHEWLGVALGILFTIHIILHWKWFIGCTKCFLRRMKAETRLNYILDILIYLGFTTIIFSGLMISENFLPTFGVKIFQNPFWKEVHFVSVDITLFVVALHVALHWKWIANNFKRYIINPIKGKATTNKIPNEITVKSQKSRSSFFSVFVDVGYKLFLILALSGLVSFGWYAVSGANSTRPTMQEQRQFRGGRGEGFRNHRDFDRRSEGRFRDNHERRHEERGHHDDRGFFGTEILKVLLIFALLTFIVTLMRKMGTTRNYGQKPSS
jgi:cytochrome b561